MLAAQYVNLPPRLALYVKATYWLRLGLSYNKIGNVHIT